MDCSEKIVIIMEKKKKFQDQISLENPRVKTKLFNLFLLLLGWVELFSLQSSCEPLIVNFQEENRDVRPKMFNCPFLILRDWRGCVMALVVPILQRQI